MFTVREFQEVIDRLEREKQTLDDDIQRWLCDMNIDYWRRHQGRLAARVIQKWWRECREPVPDTAITLKEATDCYRLMGKSVPWHRLRRRILDRYIAAATHPDHPATKYLAQRQIKQQQF